MNVSAVPPPHTPPKCGMPYPPARRIPSNQRNNPILNMKYFVVFALCVAAASAFSVPPTVTGADAAQVQQIIEAIYHPSTDPATAAALEQMLFEILGMNKPVIVEDSELPTIVVEPEIIDESIISEPGQNEESIIDASPVIIDESIVSEPANYRPPLVQIIVNVNNAPENAVVVEQPSPIVIPGEVVVVEQPEADEVVVVEQPEADEVVVVEQPALPVEPVIIAPIVPAPVITLPDDLN
ncbi:jg1981 [Pararge aegeria aegeria]|uniref:Jg1981 protein n=1 Tax=Pararge aegeria aegeria TaxID=348720 RepID=A0A8S4QD54_9NEOP|nr:jg1981 [Pararge aegeria aegeria]